MQTIAYQAGRVIDGIGEQPLENVALVVRGSRVASLTAVPDVPVGVDVVELGDVTLMPGLIDAHVHLVWDASPDPSARLEAESKELTVLRAARHALQTLHGGVTTVRDAGCPTTLILALREAIRVGVVSGPRILASGSPLVMTGGHCYGIGKEVDGADEVRKATRELIKERVDFVKAMASGGIYTEGEEKDAPQLTVQELAEAVATAHAANRRVAAHAYGERSIDNAIRAGVDTIEHGLFVTQALLRSMRDLGMFLVPTMSVYRAMATQGADAGIPQWAVDKLAGVVDASTRGFQLATEEGVQVVAGTDSGAPCHSHSSLAKEVAMMIEFGASPMQAMKSATSLAARALDIEGLVGTLEPGKMADAIAVDGNPLEDVSCLERVVFVLTGGRQVTLNGDRGA